MVFLTEYDNLILWKDAFYACRLPRMEVTSANGGFFSTEIQSAYLEGQVGYFNTAIGPYTEGKV